MNIRGSTQCPFQKLVSPFMDEMLPEKKAERMRTHLRTCTVCREELDVFMGMEQMLVDMPEIEPSENFDRTFWAKVSEMEAKPERKPFFQFLFSGWRPYVASAATALTILGVVAVHENLRSLSTEEIVIAENVDMLKDYELISKLDMLENWEDIKALETES